MASNTTVNSTLPDACSLLGIFAWKESYLTPTTFIMYLITVVLETLMCPFTILLNSLVILAAKRKRYLRKQKTCVLLACLAVTDLLVGAVVLPLVVTSHILRLLGKRLVCIVDKIATETVYIGCGASLFHLAIISGERYVAIKHSLRYETLVTTERLRVAIAFAWAVPVISALGSAILGLAGESVLRNHVIDGAISTSAMLSVLVTVSFSALPRCKTLTTDVTAEGDILHVLRHKSCSSSSFSSSRGSLFLVVLWFSWFSGSRGSLVLVVLWFSWFSWFSGSRGSLVPWFSWFSGSRGSLVPWFSWFSWFSGSRGSLVPWFSWFSWFSGSRGSLVLVPVLSRFSPILSRLVPSSPIPLLGRTWFCHLLLGARHGV